jgi:hypothetical protein
MTTHAALIEALTQLVDEYRQASSITVTAVQLVQDIDQKQDGIVRWPLNSGYQALLAEATAMIKRHFGTTALDRGLMIQLLIEMEDLEENANE